MNKVILVGRLTKDPQIYAAQDENSQAVARYTLAVDRRFKKQNGDDRQQTADFISCVAFGRSAEFAEKYLHQGTKICLEGRIQTGRYTNRDGQTVYTTDVVVENQEFAESKSASGQKDPAKASSSNSAAKSAPEESDAGFMNLPDGIDEELPFH